MSETAKIVSISVGLVSLIGTLLAFALWLGMIHNDVVTLKENISHHIKQEHVAMRKSLDANTLAIKGLTVLVAERIPPKQ